MHSIPPTQELRKVKKTAQKRVFDAQIASSKSTHYSFSLENPPNKHAKPRQTVANRHQNRPTTSPNDFRMPRDHFKILCENFQKIEISTQNFANILQNFQIFSDFETHFSTSPNFSPRVQNFPKFSIYTP